MQKHAYFKNTKRYNSYFAPLPVDNEISVYYDEEPICLPYAEDFPKTHYHDRYEIGICKGGEGLFLCEGNFYSLKEGDVVFIPPKQKHYSRSIYENAPCICRFIYISERSLKGILEGKDEDFYASVSFRVPSVISKDTNPDAVDFLTALDDLCTQPLCDRSTAMVLRLAVFLIESERWFSRIKETEAISVTNQDTDHAIGKIAEYLALHYDQCISVGELADMCYLSQSQLRRLFNKNYGMPPLAYRNFIRCNIASKLLKYSNMSVWEITNKIGFSSSSDFYRSFKKYFKVSPHEYRKNSRN